MDSTATQKYKIGDNCIFDISYHLVWCSKRRARVLVGNIAEDVKEIFGQIAHENQFKIKILEVMSDHINLFVSAHPKISINAIVSRLKGATSSKLRKKYPQLLKLPCLWSGSYYCGTIGTVSDSIIKLYIENQKSK